MCLGAVFVLGGVGMAVSQVSSAYPNLCKLITGWVKTSLPEDFPFSSLQINYNYAARKHVDGNNIGPSYIRSLGKHTGGELWTADAFVEATDEDTGEKYVKGGGGQQVLIPVSRTTRGHRTMTWVVSLSSLSEFGPRRGRRGVSEGPRSRRWRRRDVTPPRRRRRGRQSEQRQFRDGVGAAQVRLWSHELKRVFEDRLTTTDDHAWFVSQLTECVSQKFGMKWC